MKKRPCIYLVLALIIAFGACDAPVFYMISVEPPIAEPLIGGSPTNFVEFKGKLYVASGSRIYSYDGNNWKAISSQPGNRVGGLAATNNYLYALCVNDSNNSTTLKSSGSGSGNWQEVKGTHGGYDRIQSVYAENNMVFIGAQRNENFIILYMADNNAAYKPLTPGGTSDNREYRLCGIAYDGTYYYLCTSGNIIYQTNAADVSPVVNPKKPEDSVEFTGIINIGSTILAITRRGNLYNVTGAAITKVQDISIGNDRYSTGALAVWRDETDTPTLLLAGRQDSLVYAVNSGYTYGYMELEIDSGGIRNISFAEPGRNPPSSVADNERYVSTIGKYPVNHIFQAPKNIDGNMTLFASTQKNGVWSYRVRDGIPQWNAEE